MTTFLFCKHCGNVNHVLHDSGVPVICCGEPMTALKANTVDASQEKHVPVLKRNGNTLTVEVGALPHPMTADHYIEWIAVVQGQLVQTMMLTLDKPAAAAFTVGDGPLTAYAYCNLHGLWSAAL